MEWYAELISATPPGEMPARQARRRRRQKPKQRKQRMKPSQTSSVRYDETRCLYLGVHGANRHV